MKDAWCQLFLPLFKSFPARGLAGVMSISGGDSMTHIVMDYRSIMKQAYELSPANPSGSHVCNSRCGAKDRSVVESKVCFAFCVSSSGGLVEATLVDSFVSLFCASGTCK
jgi:hypothetical protein